MLLDSKRIRGINYAIKITVFLCVLMPRFFVYFFREKKTI